jgi:hypothetical protein
MADTPVPANDGDWASDDGRSPRAGRRRRSWSMWTGSRGRSDLFLSLARTQKVDLRAISVLALVEQYLIFIEEARALGWNWLLITLSWRRGSPSSNPGFWSRRNRGR